MTSRLPTVADLPPAERQKLAALARAEIAHPVGGYDVVTLGDAHPLDHLVQQPEEPFIGELARRAIAELRAPSGKYGGDAATRKALAHSIGLAEDQVMPNNYRPRRNAFDQDPAMPARGRNFPDPNGEGETIDAEEAQARLQQIFDQLDEAERPNMLAALQMFLDEQGASTAESTNEGALDRGRRPAQDAALAARIRTANHRSAQFSKRWDHLVGHLEVWK